MFSLKSKATALIAGGALCVGLPTYGIYSVRNHAEERINAVESELQAVRAQNANKVQEMSSDLNFLAERMDVTRQDLDQARKVAENLKKENTQATKKLQTAIASHSKAMDRLRADAESKLDAVQQDTTTKIGAVSGDVQTVRLDLDATKSDLAASRKEIGDVRTLVAHNAGELAELRRRGERDYFEFDIRKSKDTERIGDVRVQLKKTDTKKQKYDVVLLLDDAKMEKKDRLANEPVTFLVGRDRLRYELVVNYVDKDRVRGYISTPKDKVLSAEGPAFRAQQ